jgi:alkylation response protein AidB-like acyl-CoA dehydrogenase
VASLTTRAELRDDRFVLNGRRSSPPRPRRDNVILMAVRTDPGRPSTRISLLLVPNDTPGLDMRLLPRSPARHGHQRIFITDARVPRENLVGELNAGRGISSSI